MISQSNHNYFIIIIDNLLLLFFWFTTRMECVRDGGVSRKGIGTTYYMYRLLSRGEKNNIFFFLFIIQSINQAIMAKIKLDMLVVRGVSTTTGK